MKRDEIIGTIKALVKSLEKNINYSDFDNNYQNMSSYKDYIISRYFDKISTLAINYIRLLWITETVKFDQTKDIVSNSELNKKYNHESDIELIATVLRPLLELFLELKSVDLTLTKFKGSNLEDLEVTSQLIYYEYNTTFNELKLSVCKDFYNCEPKYLKLWSDINKKEVNSFKQKFSNAGIPLLKNTKNKLLDVIKNNDNRERLLLGYDYLTFYAFISKKAHFSYSNIISENFSPKMLLDWTLFYFLTIYLQIMDFLGLEDDFKKYLSPIVDSLDVKIDETKLNSVEIGNYVIFDFGIAQVKAKKNLNLEVEYIASNAFEVGITDVIPKVFLKRELKKHEFEEIHQKFYSEPRTKYDDDKYVDFYLELMKHEPNKH